MLRLRCMLLLTMLLVFLQEVMAQASSFSFNATIGVATPVVDNGVALHLGFNPAYALSSRFSVEGQLSYLRTQITGSFLSGNKGHNNSVNLLAGGRLYLNAEEKNTRIYLNALLGGTYSRETINEQKRDGILGLGFSGGLHFSFSSWVIGVSLDTPQHLLLKAGYTF
ncbi:MAG: hypothetical protein AAFO94_02020 [Bacteroidota bacterium]